MKNKILNLRKEGKSYREIQAVLGCSRSLVSYYVNPTGKEMVRARQNRNRFARRNKYKQLLGGKCCRCNYNHCLDALVFHHRNPEEKLFVVTDAIFGKIKYTEEEILTEIKKCDLVCANCHAEIHSKNDFRNSVI
jgi:hypothetical protein